MSDDLKFDCLVAVGIIIEFIAMCYYAEKSERLQKQLDALQKRFDKQ